MSDSDEDTGLTLNQLWALAWFLGIVGAASWLILATRLGEAARLEEAAGLDATWGMWLACAALGTVFSACCAILAGVKGAESRLRALLRGETDRAS